MEREFDYESDAVPETLRTNDELEVQVIFSVVPRILMDDVEVNLLSFGLGGSSGPSFHALGSFLRTCRRASAR
jgi:hypothetical protein